MPDITLHETTAKLVANGVDYGLQVLGGTITMDDAWAPFIQATLELRRPPASVDELLALNVAARRVVVTVKSTLLGASAPLSSKTFNLGLRSRRVDHKTGRLIIELASDEALLQDLVYAQLVPGWQSASLENQASLVQAIDYSLLSQLGKTVVPESSIAHLDVVTIPSSVNNFTNPRAGINLANAAANNATLQRATNLVAPNTSSYFLSSPTNADNYLRVDGAAAGPESGMKNGMRPGGTYTVSGDIHLSAPQAGTISPYARRTVVVYWVNDQVRVDVCPAQANNLAGRTRLTHTFTLPENTQSASIRFYGGATGGGNVNWTNLRISEGQGGNGDGYYDYAYFDGDIADGGYFTYEWQGTPHLSPSIRTASHGRDPELLVKKPGQTDWDYIQNIIEPMGVRLYCDAERVWRLVPAAWALGPAHPRLAVGENVIELSESLSRDDGSFFNGAFVIYTWEDEFGRTRQRYDRAYTTGEHPVRTKVFEISGTYPGPGAAQAYLNRARGAGGVLEIEAVSDYRTEPLVLVDVVTPESSTALVRQVQAVTFNLANNTMRVKTRLSPVNPL